jgi:hypothetical protein
MKLNSKPNVLVAGFPKSGSTYLYHLLKQHPEIFIPKIKEINYFNKDNFFLSNPEILNPRYFKSKKWYYSFFKTNKRIVMDFSIISALDIGSAKRVKRELGDIKIIFVKRNQKDFVNSIKNFVEKEGGNPKEAIERYSDLDYYTDNYKRIFSEVYIISLENLNKNPKRELGKLMSFLGLDNHDFKIDLSEKERHETSVYKMNWLQYFKRKIYVLIVKIFYKLLSFLVTAKIKAQGEK